MTRRATKTSGDPLEDARAILRASESEEQAQRTVAAWLDAHKVLWCHVPNGSARHPAVAGKLKAAGVKAGVPDLIVWDPPTRCHLSPDLPRGIRCSRAHQGPCPREAVGVALELKRGKGGVVSPDQRLWLLALEERRWIAIVGHGSHDAIAQLEALGYGAGR